MANYVKTRVEFNGTEEDVKKVMDFLNEEDFSFQRIVPYPKYYNCPKEYLVLPSEIKKDGIFISCPSKGVQLSEEYPYLDWWQFCVDNWGTARDADVVIIEKNVLWFDTDWTFADKVLLQLSEMFPEVILDFMFADEDIGNNCGCGTIQNGVISYDKLDLDQRVALANEIWDNEEVQ